MSNQKWKRRADFSNPASQSRVPMAIGDDDFRKSASISSRLRVAAKFCIVRLALVGAISPRVATSAIRAFGLKEV